MHRCSTPKYPYPTSIFSLVLLALLLVGCDSTQASTIAGNTHADGGKGCMKVGILLPDSITSPRWETKDHPLLEQAIKQAIPNVQINYANAQGSSDTQLTQAETALAQGDCILVVAAHDSVAAAQIVSQAKTYNVPVIAYDRLIQSRDTSYYVSFDGTAVGELQGEYIATHYSSYVHNGIPNVIMISGSQTDTNALLFSKGLHEELDPLFAQNNLKNINEIFTPDWNVTSAQAEMAVTLADQNNNIQIAYVANDDMANTVIAALKTAKVNSPVLVTGQDATVNGIHNILTGDQSMTVYKPIFKEAQSVGILVKAIYQGNSTAALTKGANIPTADGGNVPTVLDTPLIVDSTNIASTVIADSFVSKAAICKDIPVGTDGVC